ncbi:hypothetical protein V1460_35735 [Streptomyces sp. SCSIO 30461]|uniref:hypothetical protein n=1 Tax=Streptomyces sp. SCSIO 30461 TaxID=3118085 RepID=UPI0030CFCDE8
MTHKPRTRAPQAALTDAQKHELDRARKAADDAVAHFRETAGRIAVDLGRGGAPAVARHMEWTPQYASTLAAAYKAKQAAEGSETEEVAA